jgi:hypothetical protein
VDTTQQPGGFTRRVSSCTACHPARLLAAAAPQVLMEYLRLAFTEPEREWAAGEAVPW